MNSSEDRLRKRLKQAGVKDENITWILDEFRKQEGQCSRLRERLKRAGAVDEDITLALDEFRKRERQRCRLLQSKVKRLNGEVKRLRAQRDSHTAQGGAANTHGQMADHRFDRLLEIRDEIAEAKQTLALAADEMRSQDGGNEVANSLMETQNLIQRLTWILFIGLGVVAPATMLILVLTIWRMFAS